MKTKTLFRKKQFVILFLLTLIVWLPIAIGFAYKFIDIIFLN